MRTVRSVQLRQLDGMSLNEIIELVKDMGYSTEALSNDDMHDLAVSIIDGHEDEGDVEELDFGAQVWPAEE